MLKGSKIKERDIEERCFRFALDIIKLTETFPKTQSAFMVAGQLIRSGTSVGANREEGNDAVSRKEFINYMNTSRKSARESIFWLRISQAKKWGDQKEVKRLITEATEIRKIFSSIILKAKKGL